MFDYLTLMEFFLYSSIEIKTINCIPPRFCPGTLLGHFGIQQKLRNEELFLLKS